MARVGVIGFLHESNTFLEVPTVWQDFEATSMTAGAAMQSRWAEAHHELGGMIAGCEAEDLECVPGFATYAVPSGTISASCFERIADSLLDSVRGMGMIDGLLIALHGATVSEHYRDADGEILRRLRELVGARMPLVVTLDLHANVSERMVSQSTAIVAYRSNPHLDQRDRGLEAATLMARILRGEVEPVMHLESPPLAIPIAAQHTAVDPARKLYSEDLAEVLRWPGVLSASICMGFYYADVREMGASFLVVANRNAELARRGARFLAARCWGRRREFVVAVPSVVDAVRYAATSSKRPVALMDIGDNVGGGSSAASTVIFEELLRQGTSGGLVVLHDPPCVARCIAAGVRAVVDLPIVGRARVRTLSDGLFTETQVRHGGWTHCDQGVTAVVESEVGGHTVVYTSRRMAPMSLEQLLSLGIHPERKRILIVKGVVAPRAAYEPVAGEFVLVDSPGPTANDPGSFAYRYRRRPMFPMEEVPEE